MTEEEWEVRGWATMVPGWEVLMVQEWVDLMECGWGVLTWEEWEDRTWVGWVALCPC